MLDTLSARELAEWEALFLIEPWGERHFEVLWARYMAMYHNANIGKKGKAKGAKDFMPDWWGEQEEQSPEDMMAAMKTLADGMRAKHGGLANPQR